MNRFGDRSAVTGATSILTRSDDGVAVAFVTSGLEPGAAYTLWWVIFNNPEACASSPCSAADLAPNRRGATGASVGFAAGHVLPATGRAGFGATLKAGETAGFLFGPGLVKPLTAEIHMVARNHGQPISGQLQEQITTFGGGCETNRCTDDQFAIHIASAEGVIPRLDAIKRLLDRIALANSIVPNPTGAQ